MKNLILGLTTATLAAAAVGIAAPANAETQLGNIGVPEVQAWCETQGHGGESRPSNPNDPYSWHCWAASDQRTGVAQHPVTGVNMNAVCDHQYGSPAWSKLKYPHSAYGWVCWR